MCCGREGNLGLLHTNVRRMAVIVVLFQTNSTHNISINVGTNIFPTFDAEHSYSRSPKSTWPIFQDFEIRLSLGENFGVPFEFGTHLPQVLNNDNHWEGAQAEHLTTFLTDQALALTRSSETTLSMAAMVCDFKIATREA